MKTRELPDDIKKLKEIIIDLETRHDQELRENKNKYLILEEKLKVLQRRFFGRKSEKTEDENPDQPQLFNEAELHGNLDKKQSARMDEKKPVKSHFRKKKRKNSFPSHIPVIEETHDLSEEEKNCPCCNNERPCIGHEETKELDIIPEQVRVIKHIIKKYGPCECEGFKNSEVPEIVSSRRQERILPGIIASVGLLAYIFVSKFLDSMPFYRQEKRFNRFGVNISRTNMCNWLLAGSRKCGDLLDLMWKIIRAGPFIQMDETGMQVLKEPGRLAKQKGYMFVTIGYDKSNKPLIVYHYHRTRNQSIVADVLKGFKGHLQTDGLNIYDNVENTGEILKVGCGAHSRRNFFEAAELCQSKDTTAHKVLKYFRKIYRIEKRLRNELHDKNIDLNEFVKKRKEQTALIMEEMYNFLQREKDAVAPGCKLGKAISYALNKWKYWIRYLDKWYLTPDNNYTERKIRNYVIGRKNWFFSDTLRGAHASSTMFSLIQTARENGLNPYWYLRYLFTKLPAAATEEDLKKLLPTELEPEEIKQV